ncbi:MAG: hypothetical protein ACTHZ9_02430 [Leucobacter sp.]
MDTKKVREIGLRTELPIGTDEAVAIDELVDDILHGDVKGALHTLHEPHDENHSGHTR